MRPGSGCPFPLFVSMALRSGIWLNVQGTRSSTCCMLQDNQYVSDYSRYGGAGAVWDIWRRDDVGGLRRYLTNHCAEFVHGGKLVTPEDVEDVIHTQVLSCWLPRVCSSDVSLTVPRLLTCP